MGFRILSKNNTITLILLWIAVIVWSIWFGGTIYQMLVIVPIWGDSLPESLHAFFRGTSYNHNIGHFFGPAWMPVRFLPLYGMLFFGWRLPAHRPLFIVAAICLTFVLVFTLLYVYPINAVLFTQAGGDHSTEEIRAMLHRWIIADRARFAVACIGYFALLRALSIPIAKPTAWPFASS
jgi:hypothetical protein